MPEGFVNWEYLGTVAGAAFVVAWVVQWLKNKLAWDPKLIAYGVAVLVLNFGALGMGVWTPSFFGLSWVNAIVVALTATGEYEGLKSLGFMAPRSG